jgi:hypothetical protein
MSGSELRMCSKCRCTMLLDLYFEKNKKGEWFKTCNKCRTPVPCIQCGQIFRNNSNRNAHMKAIHAQIKDHPCLQCESKFSTASGLRKHTKFIHDKIKDCHCPHCEYKCSRSGDLQAHVKQIHTKIKDNKCSECGMSFSRSCGLSSHIKFVHRKIKNHACNECDYTCSRNSDLQSHIKFIHRKIKDHACNECDYTCSSKSQLNRHIKICTGKLNISSGELACSKALELLNIDYETEVCEIKNDNGNWLRWDFKINVNGTIKYIEYDGQAHFKPVCFGGISESEALQNFNKQQLHDKIKNDYCSKHSYPLLRIPYYRFEDVMELIRDFTALTE